MAENLTPEKRSKIMSAVRGKNTKPELLVRKYLHASGLRFRIHPKGLPGRPDLVLPGLKTVVFVNGCFWHGHLGCPGYRPASTRANWWGEKIEGTRQRDRANNEALQAAGWNVITVWECELPARLESLRDELVTLKIGVRK